MGTESQICLWLNCLRLKALQNRIFKPKQTKSPQSNRSPLHIHEDIIDLIFARLFPYIPFDSPEFYHNEISYHSRNDSYPPKCQIKPLCLISRSWLVPVRRVLYRTISFQSEIPELWDILMNSPHLRIYVVRLYFPLKITNSLTAEFGALFPNCAIYITMPPALMYVEKLLAQMNYLGYPRVGQCHPKWIWRDGFRNWTRLQVLEIKRDKNRTPGYYLDRKENLEPLLPSLCILKLRGTRGLQLPLTTSNTLHTLVIVGCLHLDASMFRDLASRHSGSLRRIHIQYNTFTSGDTNSNFVDMLAHSTFVQDLIIHDNDPLSTSFFDSVPISLVDITFSTRVTTDLFNQLQTLLQNRRKTPQLRVVAICTQEDSLEIEPLKLRTRCDGLIRMGKDDGIEFFFYTQYMRSLPIWALEGCPWLRVKCAEKIQA
jgi:hypothetical protein